MQRHRLELQADGLVRRHVLHVQDDLAPRHVVPLQLGRVFHQRSDRIRDRREAGRDGYVYHHHARVRRRRRRKGCDGGYGDAVVHLYPLSAVRYVYREYVLAHRPYFRHVEAIDDLHHHLARTVSRNAQAVPGRNFHDLHDIGVGSVDADAPAPRAGLKRNVQVHVEPRVGGELAQRLQADDRILGRAVAAERVALRYQPPRGRRRGQPVAAFQQREYCVARRLHSGRVRDTRSNRKRVRRVRDRSYTVVVRPVDAVVGLLGHSREDIQRRARGVAAGKGERVGGYRHAVGVVYRVQLRF